MSEVLPLAAVKARLSELVDLVQKQQERVVITRRGRPVAVLINPDDLESLEETLEIMSNPKLMRQIRQGLRAAERGEGIPLEQLVVRRKRAG